MSPRTPELPTPSRREREIMDILFRRGQASAAEVLEELRDPPSYSAVRALLAKLEQKGHVTHTEEGRAYVYAPVVRKDAARQSALSHLLRTFFDNSTEKALAALLAARGRSLTQDELARMEELVKRAREEGR
jgi:BlaI family transcriptional regulator, penicillinase repressor